MGSFFAFVLIQDRISSAGCFPARDASTVTASISNASMFTMTRFLDEAVRFSQLLVVIPLGTLDPSSVLFPGIYKYLART